MSDDTETYDLVKMRTAVHEAETQLAHLKLRVQTGELLDRHKLVREIASMGHRHRDLLLSLPVRHASIIAADVGVAPRLLLVAMDKLIRAELTGLAAGARQRQVNPETTD